MSIEDYAAWNENNTLTMNKECTVEKLNYLNKKRQIPKKDLSFLAPAARIELTTNP